MIFATVGTQLPFDRLIKGLDEWASSHVDDNIFAQTGNSTYIASNFSCAQSLAPSEFQYKLVSADLVVAHAGMGTILQCLDLSKPLIIMPRKADLGEHRNDHQIATAEKFKNFETIQVVENEQELLHALDNPPGNNGSDVSSKNVNLERLINEIRTFIEKD